MQLSMASSKLRKMQLLAKKLSKPKRLAVFQEAITPTKDKARHQLYIQIKKLR